MPMLPFLPWATATDTLSFGRFRVAPAGAALSSGEIPEEHGNAVRTILASYAKKRRVDQDSVALIRREDRGFTDNLSDEEVTEYFGFRIRLAFAVLAARRFFSHRYANSDSITLVIQGFAPEGAGTVLLPHRRRDGHANIIVPAGKLMVPRPHNVDWCALPEDLDARLLNSLEAAAEADGASWPALVEALRLFVGANTDSPGVGMHTELIDVVSAFSRVAGSWDTKGTVGSFRDVLPVPETAVPLGQGPKLQHPRVIQEIGKGRSVREVWLEQAYVLRSQFSHGRVEHPSNNPVWTEREHLLLAAIAFPLYVKASLARDSLYEFTDDDSMMNSAFDALTVLEPFSRPDEDTGPWRETMMRAEMRSATARIERDFLQDWAATSLPTE